MAIRRPSPDELEEIANQAGFRINEGELEDYSELVDGTLGLLDRIREIPGPKTPGVCEPDANRSGGHRPNGSENPHNIWITKSRVTSQSEGLLEGMRIGLKDTISLAGVEMTCGSYLLEEYVPSIDATIVSRLLNAGASIEGKLNMEAFALSGSSDTSDFGTVTNPIDSDYLAGGSSSGSAAAVAAGEVEIAIGGDQGGSIRLPSAWCGVVGLKPTWGLVPYTGAVGLEPSIDHLGPIANSVTDVAKTLSVIAGDDGLDPRQPNSLDIPEYHRELDGDISDLRVAVLEEGFGGDDANEDIDDTVRYVISKLEDLGAETTPVSIPRHNDALTIAYTSAGFGGISVLKHGGLSVTTAGWKNTNLAENLGKALQGRADDLPPTVKSLLLAIEYARQNGYASLFGKARNIARLLKIEYDEVLKSADVIAMPTVSLKPFEVKEDLSLVERVRRTGLTGSNTSPFNLTGHPAISVPCGFLDGLPVGLMFVGDQYDDGSVLAAAKHVEDNIDPT